MAYRLAVIERFAGLTVVEPQGAFWKQKPLIDLGNAVGQAKITTTSR